ncbi:MAG TPA: hypothetical protein VIR54_18400 [Vicinamibacterales bacterium]
MRREASGAAAAVLLALVVGAFRFLSIAGLSNDHYMHLAAGQQIAFGEWPSRDYVELGLPLMEGLSAIPFLVLPDAPLLGEAVLVAVMFGLAAAFTLFAAQRLTDSWWIAFLVVFLEIVIFPRTYSYPKVLAYALGFLSMWRYVERPSRVVELAIAVALAFGLRHDHGFYLGAGAVLTVIVVSRPEGWRVVTRRTGAFIGIVLLFLAPYIIYTSIYDGLWRHIMRGVELLSIESSRGRRLPVFTWSSNLLAANAVPWLYFLFHLLPIVAVAVVWRRWRHGSELRERAMVAPLIVVAVLVNAGLIRDTLSARLPDAVVPAALLLGWLMAGAYRVRPSRRAAAAWLTCTMIAAITVASAASVGETKSQLEKAEMLGTPARLWRHVHTRVAEFQERLPLGQIPSRIAWQLLPFFKYADRCLAPTDHILTPGFAPEVAVWARRPFAGGQVWFQVGVLAGEEDQRYVMSRLGEQRVPVAILVAPSSEKIMTHFDGFRRYIRDQFTAVTPLEGDGDAIAEIAFNPSLAIGRDRETGWPCYR